MNLFIRVCLGICLVSLAASFLFGLMLIWVDRPGDLVMRLLGTGIAVFFTSLFAMVVTREYLKMTQRNAPED